MTAHSDAETSCGTSPPPTTSSSFHCREKTVGLITMAKFKFSAPSCAAVCHISRITGPIHQRPNITINHSRFGLKRSNSFFVHKANLLFPKNPSSLLPQRCLCFNLRRDKTRRQEGREAFTAETLTP